MHVHDVAPSLEKLDRDYGSEEEALAALAEATRIINEFAGETGQYLAADREDRLREWLKRLRSIAERAADAVHATGFSISVSFPAGVSVSINFEKASAQALGRSPTFV